MKKFLLCIILCVVAAHTYKASCNHIDNIIKENIQRIEKAKPCSFNGKYITLHKVKFTGPRACPDARINEVKMEVDLGALITGELKLRDVQLSGIEYDFADGAKVPVSQYVQNIVESNIKEEILEKFNNR